MSVFPALPLRLRNHCERKFGVPPKKGIARGVMAARGALRMLE